MSDVFVYSFGEGHADGNASMRDLLGGKGSGLAEMTNAGVPVPPGYTITTAVCRAYYAQGQKLPAGFEAQHDEALAMLERRGREKVELRIGTTYAVAAAATILFLAKDPHGDAQMVNLLKGDILATTSTSLTWMMWILGTVGVALFAFRKELLLVSFDRDLAVVFGKHATLWDVVLYLLIGVVISLGVMTAGPMATFGFLILPPATVRLFTRRMVSFSLASAALGGATAFGGFYCAYRFDLPLGPAEVGLASVVLATGSALYALRRHS